MASDLRQSPAECLSQAPVRDPMLKIVLGTRLKLEHGLNEEKISFTGILTGMTPGEYLIVRVFANHQIIDRLKEGESIFAWYLSEGDAYAFSSTISSTIIKPAFMVFLDYPQEVKNWKIRGAQRVPCGFSATVKAGSVEHRAVIVNISEGGCKVCMDNSGLEPLSFDIGQRITLCFYVGEVARAQAITSIVKYLRKDAEFLEMGVEFDKEDDAVLRDVRQYVAGLVHKLGS